MSLNRREILAKLADYRSTWASGAWRSQTSKADRENEARDEEERLSIFENFIEANPKCFERTNLKGHLTGSAMIVRPDLHSVLLTHHRKLGKWLQLGGHADGHPRIHEVAMREGEEESGISRLQFHSYEQQVFPEALSLESPLIFDLDAHFIPTRGKEPEHIHYDVRFLVVASAEAAHKISDESLDLQWFPIAEARRANPEASMQRQFDKINFIASRLVGR